MADYTDRNRNKLRIDDVLVLSTGHLTRKTINRIDNNHSDMPAAALWPCYGFFVWVDESWRNTSPASDDCAELANAIDFAAKRGCQWIRFDVDGPQVDELPMFDHDVKLCSKCEGPITTPLLKGEELCVHCADYDESDPDHAERVFSHHCSECGLEYPDGNNLCHPTAIVETIVSRATDHAERANADHDRYRQKAKLSYSSDEIEIDDNAAVSEGDDGAFVAAWVWVRNTVTDDSHLFDERQAFVDEQQSDKGEV